MGRGEEAREAADVEETGFFAPEAQETYRRFRDMFAKTYRNIPSWVLGRCTVENPEAVGRLVDEAWASQERGDRPTYRDLLSKLYQETLDIKVHHGRKGRKVQQFLETIARRAGWSIGGKPVDLVALEDALVAVMSHEPFFQECLEVMRGKPGARERAPEFLENVLRRLASASGGDPSAQT